MAYPLFITRQSLSNKTGIGNQTVQYLELFPSWKHLFWDGAQFMSLDARSAKLESHLFCRIGILKRDPKTLPARVLSGFGCSWWQGHQLKPSVRKWLERNYMNDISAVYLAPLSKLESDRMRYILSVLKKPFVVHLWDILDHNQLESESFRWLIERAAHVFCLSEAMIDYISPLRRDAQLLRFVRKPSAYLAKPPGAGPLRIALIGYCESYLDGMLILDQALRILRRRNLEVELVYVGSRKRVKKWGIHWEKEVQVTGYAESNDERDRLLSECHVGFLPGPLAAPEVNSRSRFSIPCRVIDYMAIGLPVVGTVHPQSATATYLEVSGLSDRLGANSPELLADRLLALSCSESWKSCSDLSRKGFAAARNETSALVKSMQDTASAGVRI